MRQCQQIAHSPVSQFQIAEAVENANVDGCVDEISRYGLAQTIRIAVWSHITQGFDSHLAISHCMTVLLHAPLSIFHRIKEHGLLTLRGIIWRRRNNSQHNLSHLSLDIEVVLLPTATAPGVGLGTAVLALVFAAVGGALGPRVVEVSAASSQMFCVSVCSRYM